MLLGTLAASLLGSALVEKGVIRAGQNFLMRYHPLNNLKIPQYYENESKFNGVYSRNNLGICNKSWWAWIIRNSLDCFVC